MHTRLRLRTRAALLAVLACLLTGPLAPAAEAQQLLHQLVSADAEEDGEFGTDVAGIADVNGDGRGDLLVGAPQEEGTPDFGEGAAYVFSGGTGALIHELQSPEPFYTLFGFSVAGVPDVNGDQVADLLIGAPFAGDEPFEGAGRAYVYSGATGALIRELESPNGEDFEQFGASVAGLNDVNGDGRGDLLVGAPKEGDGGLAYVFSGASGAVLHTLAPDDGQPIANFGTSVDGVPDVNGDGRDDPLIGAPTSAFYDEPGRAYLFSGATGDLLREVTSPNPEHWAFGHAVAGVPDANGDGRGDLLVGALFEDGGPIDAGRTYLFSGASGALLHELVSPNPEYNGQFGNAVAGVRDVDGDGQGDLLVGARNEDAGPSPGSDGRAYLFSGATGALLFELSSPNADSFLFGYSVSGVPDVNGDGRSDLLVGAVGELSGAGRAYVFSGGVGGALAVSAKPVGGPVVIGPGGGSFQFTVTLTNTSSQPHTFQAWSAATGPVNREPIIGPQTVTLPAGATVTRTLTQQVPANAPPGQYTYHVRLGTYPGTVLASDVFPVVKQAARGVGVAASDAGDWSLSGWEEAAAASAALHDGFALSEASPNPFSRAARLTLDLAAAQAVTAEVYDALGRRVAALHEGQMGAGAHTFVFGGSSLPAGLYVIRVTGETFSATRRVTLVQ